MGVVQSIAREKFVALAEKRVARTIKDIRLIGNLSNKSNYSYDESDVKKIMLTLESEMKILKKRFAENENQNKVVFKLE